MSEEIVKIKGSKSGLQLSFAEGATFEAVRKDIEEKLISGSGFFLRGTLVLLPHDAFSEEERGLLQKMFHEHGLICRTLNPETQQVPSEQVRKENQQEKQQQQQAAAKAAARREKVQEMVVVNRTLRGGQEIRTESSVMVCGNVNPGAQIIAGGSIDIRGTCRGMVHAGAFGDSTAFIIADHLMPTQIRISNLIARSPDEMEKTERAERASIKEGRIVIEPIER
ncbi:septum site-determining protein MinC [Selenomonas sp. GACV-9]|uniref:septum site-determining protein MinC n=1 Tax=Selenomonas sp. GACV-9 TaxID=3158782 RepID=UPI0008E064D6|nr:septum site-determining protein MinC [Selenomonas ruminantium]